MLRFLKNVFLNLTLILASTVCMLLALYMLDKIFGLINPQKVPPFRSFFPATPTPPYGYHAGTPKQRHRKIGLDNEVLFDVEYTADKYHRRPIPQTEYKKSKLALFFGGSNTFGEGLDVSASIPAQFEKKNPEYHVYNYAYRGYGPQQMLIKLRKGFEPGELENKSGDAFYIFFRYHLNRVAGTAHVLGWSSGVHPHFVIDENGQLINKGFFSTTEPFSTFFLMKLGRSHVLKYFKSEPRKPNEDHYKITCAIFNESHERLAKMGLKLHVLAPYKNKTVKKLNKCLKEKILLHPSLLFNTSKSERFMFKGDGHLNSKGAMVISDWISEIVRDVK